MRTFVLFLSSLLFLLSAQAQVNNNLRDTLTSDFDSFIKILEETHPDPYTRFGGKVFFHKAAYEVRSKLEKGRTGNTFRLHIL